MKTVLLIFIAFGTAAFLFAAIGKYYIESAPLIGWFVGLFSFLIASVIAYFRIRG
jgi:membrane protein implicated in regulation of membrane protease activity